MVALMLALAIMFTLGACGGGRKDLVENAEIWSEALTAKLLEAISINDDITIAGTIAIVKTENDGIGIGVTPCYLVENRGTNAAWVSVN
ncbi:MAG: hypothetical protein ACLTWR_08650 [Agathobaculum desmolans]|uniref:hypothetical protein n=1 Tax=Agathobaculum desmolans TaxID=39484 RepID=UPI0004E1F59D|nr:hypothetical protein [Agathobaculum desmolans]